MYYNKTSYKNTHTGKKNNVSNHHRSNIMKLSALRNSTSETNFNIYFNEYIKLQNKLHTTGESSNCTAVNSLYPAKNHLVQSTAWLEHLKKLDENLKEKIKE